MLNPVFDACCHDVLESTPIQELVNAGKKVVLESLPDSSCAAEFVTDTQAASSSAAEAGSTIAGKTAAGVKSRQSLGKRRPSAAPSKKKHTTTDVVEISDDDDDDFVPDAKVSRNQSMWYSTIARTLNK